MTPENWYQFQARPNLLHTRSWDLYFCKKEVSCKFLFAHILSNDALYACRIPLEKFESWDFGPKIGLDGLDGLDQVWTALPPDVHFDLCSNYETGPSCICRSKPINS